MVVAQTVAPGVCEVEKGNHTLELERLRMGDAQVIEEYGCRREVRDAEAHPVGQLCGLWSRGDLEPALLTVDWRPFEEVIMRDKRWWFSEEISVEGAGGLRVFGRDVHLQSEARGLRGLGMRGVRHLISLRVMLSGCQPLQLLYQAMWSLLVCSPVPRVAAGREVPTSKQLDGGASGPGA